MLIPASQGPLAGVYLDSIEYNADGTVGSLGLPPAGGLPGETLAYTYDDLQRPTRMASTLTSTETAYVADVVYSPTNQPEIIEHGAEGKRVWQTFYYQYGTRRLDRAATTREGIAGKARDAVYHYTDAGTITSITDTSHDGIDNQCFAYDHLQRLTEAWSQGSAGACASEPTDQVIGGPAPYWHSFTYDKAGNRTGETRHGISGTADTVRTYTYAATGQGNRLNQVTQNGPTGQRTDTYTYDAVGNTTKRAIDVSPTNTGQTLEWDTEGELTKVTENGNDVTFVYDAVGNRLIRKDATGTTLYMSGGTELRALTGASTATGTRYYSFAGQTVAMRTSDGTLTYLTADHQGSSQVAVDAATQQTTVRRFTPFGSIRGFDDDATWPGDKGFVGGTQDPTGLTHLGAREYDPDTGRFISVDPLMDQADPQQMNGYTYANNSPVTNADPDGKMCRRTSDGMECFNGDGVDRRPNNSGGYDVYNPSGRRVATSGDSYGLSGRSPIRHRNVGSSNSIFVPKNVDIVRFREKFWKHHDGYFDFAKPTFIEDLYTAIQACWEMDCGNWLIDLRLAFADALGIVGGDHGRGGRSIKLRMPRSPKLPRCSSFVPGTTVLMADGTHKPIKDIKVGDRVLATDPETGETRAQPVVGTITSKGDKNLVQITVNASAPALGWMAGDTPEPGTATPLVLKKSKSGVLIATDTHPFWVASDINAWVEAADLKPGMWLRTSAGTYVQITATEHKTAHHQRVHNLTVDADHTYYVLAGTTPVLVHNCPAPSIRISPAASDWATKGAHIHVGSSEVRIFPTGDGGVGFKGLRMNNGMASARDVETARKAIMSSPELRADLIDKARSAMADMNNHNWGNSVNRAAEMNFLIKALGKIE